MTTPVTIIGAGLGGLTLARVLPRPRHPGHDLRGGALAEARTQGGQLDIHENNGQLALEAAGLTDEFRAIIHEGGEASRVLDQHGTVLLDEPDDGTRRTPRGAARRSAADPPRLPAGGDDPVGQKAHRRRGPRRRPARADLRRRVDRHHRACSSAPTAPGRRSGRCCRTPTPEYVGTSFVETYLYDADKRHPATAEAVGGGALFALAPGKGIVAHREAGDILHTYVALNRPAEWFAGIDFTDAAAATARVAAEFDGWAPELTALITDGDTAPVLRMIYTLPDGHRWDRVPGVTLLGDAAHLMPPSGEGANLAMFDGAELGKAIAAHPDDIEAALTAYEEAMFPRSESEPPRTRTRSWSSASATAHRSDSSTSSPALPRESTNHTGSPDPHPRRSLVLITLT